MALSRVSTGRLKKLTPNRTVVTMNQQVDEAIDLDHDTTDIDLVKNLQIPKDWPFDMNGPGFHLFIAGHAINKKYREKIKAMEDEELRHKQAMRPQHGLTARYEHIDFKATCIGWKGGMTQQLRTMTNCHIKQLRMDPEHAYHHTCITQGVAIDHELLESKK